MTESEYRIEACRSCDAPIIWAGSVATGKPMPVDAVPTPDGNVELRRVGFQRAMAVVHAAGTGLFPATDQPLRKSHFATCPQADEWRKG